jgi:hypothetical protein
MRLEDEMEAEVVEVDLVGGDEVFEDADVEIGTKDCEEPGRGSGFCEPRGVRAYNCSRDGKEVGGSPAGVVMTARMVGLSSSGGIGGGRGLSTGNCETGLTRVLS